MKPYLLGIALLLTTACHSFKPFTFVQMSDPQIGFVDDSPSYVHSDSLMKAAVDAANALKPACVIVTGAGRECPRAWNARIQRGEGREGRR